MCDSWLRQTKTPVITLTEIQGLTLKKYKLLIWLKWAGFHIWIIQSVTTKRQNLQWALWASCFFILEAALCHHRSGAVTYHITVLISRVRVQSYWRCTAAITPTLQSGFPWRRRDEKWSVPWRTSSALPMSSCWSTSALRVVRKQVILNVERH